MRMTTRSAVLTVLAAFCCTQTAAISDEPGLRLSRSDLGQLKKRDRGGLFSALRSTMKPCSRQGLVSIFSAFCESLSPHPRPLGPNEGEVKGSDHRR